MGKAGKMYLGNIPSADDGWMKIGEYVDGDKIEWLIFQKLQDHSAEWVTLKIAANGRAAGKANYWLAKNGKTGQIGFARDFAIMRDTRPGLHEQIEKIIKNC